MWAAQQDAPPPPPDVPPGQPDAPSAQDTWALPQQDAPTPGQDTWAAQPAAGFAAQPGAQPGAGPDAGPDAGDDPFAHFFRNGPADPAATQGGFTGPYGGYPGQQAGYPGAQAGYGAPPGGYAGPPGGYAAPPGGYAGPPGGFAGPQAGYAGAEGGYGGPPGPGYGETIVSQPPYPGGGPPEDQPRRGRARAITLVAGVVLVLAAGGVGAWAALGGKGHPHAGPSHHPRPANTAPSSSPQPSTSAPSTSPAPSPSSSGMVAEAPGVTGQHNAKSVLAFLNNYFTAINTHNYQQYYGLLDSQQQHGITEGQFRSGYRDTRDSRATLVALGPGAGGTVAASVTFTSHQPAGDSPSHSRCTHWSTTLYLRHHGGTYVIGAPPASYHASYQAC